MVVAVLSLNTVLNQPVNGIRIPHPQEWSGRLLKLGVVFLDKLSGDRVLKCQIDNPADEVFEMCEEVVEGDEVEFRLDVCVFRELSLSVN